MEISEDPKELAKELGPASEERIGPFIATASIALNMAMKYHDIATVQDGALYQQYKLEGKNMRELHLDMVFETAIQIEKHLIGANERIARLIAISILDAPEEEADPAADDQPTDEPNK